MGYALVDVQGTHVTRTGGESVAARSSYTEKVVHALNMLLRVCVIQSPYVDSTCHIRIPNLVHDFARRQHALESTAGCDRGLSK